MLSITFEDLLKDRIFLFFAKLPEACLRPAHALSAQPLVDSFFLPKYTTQIQIIQNAINGAKNYASRERVMLTDKIPQDKGLSETISRLIEFWRVQVDRF